MPSASAISPSAKLETRKRRTGRLSTKLIVIAICAVAILCIVVLLFSRHWPFTEAAVLEDLRESSDSQVKVQSFHETFFPSPGCVLEGVSFDHGPNNANPLITIEKLTVQGSYAGLLSSHVSRITAAGLRILVPAFGTSTGLHTEKSKITIDEVVANGALLEFAYTDASKPPLRFEIHESTLRNVGWSGPFTYRLKVRNPEPPGEVTTSGKFGVWIQGNPGETPISGEYKFEQADLGVYEGIAGTLSSSGKYSGKLSHIDISGTTDTPNFEVKSGGHPMRLTTQFDAYVDAIHGDTFLKEVDADFWKTHIVADGSVAKSPDGKGKTAIINLRGDHARIEDLLLLFVESRRAPMSGSVTLKARVEIPPGPEKFLEKVKLSGGFGIAAGTFASPSTQEGVNKLSAGARGEKDPSDPETVLTDLTGKVNLQKGTAHFADLSFGVPGAAARLHGHYNLLNHKIDLRGQMQVESKISNTETGAKAVLLKAIEPFFKKKKKGEIVPVRISGTYEHPTFGLDLNDKKAQKVPAPLDPPAKPR
jgi:hypothetical protein